MLRTLLLDETGFLISAELILIFTLMFCGVAVGMAVVRDSLVLKQAMVEYRIVIRGRAAAIGWQVSARAMFEFCVVA